MKFDITGAAEGEWFKFFKSKIKENGEIQYLDPEENAGRVQIRISNPEVVEDIQAKTRKKVQEWVHNPKTRAMERGTYYDQTEVQEKKEREMIWDYAIQDWKNLLDKDEKEIPCTLENKLKLMNIPQFARFIGRCLQLITGANIESEEVAGKN